MMTDYYQQTSRYNKYNMGIIAECSCRWWQLICSIVDSWETLGRVTTGDSLSAQQQVLWKFRGVKRSDSSLLPNSRFAEDSYD